MAIVTAPVEGFSGVVVGVQFKDGTGETAEPAQIQYFTRHGYKVEQAEHPGVPGGNSSKEDWLAYAKAQGRTDDELEGLTRDGIRDLFN
jgi:hypothetical protein